MSNDNAAIINNVTASFALEDITLTVADKERMQRLLEGKITLDEAVAEVTKNLGLEKS